jgi:hypothetical protein
MDKEKGFWSEGLERALAKMSSALPETKCSAVAPEKPAGALGSAR